MATRDILTLEKSIAPRLLRCLYFAALIVILVFTLLGVVRGVRIMTATPPPPPPAMAAAADPDTVPPTAEAPNAAPIAGPAMGQMRRPMMGGMMRPGPMMMRRRFERFHHMRGPGIMRGMPPAAVGGITILLALLRGFIALLVVRVLAEMALAVLSLKRQD